MWSFPMITSSPVVLMAGAEISGMPGDVPNISDFLACSYRASWFIAEQVGVSSIPPSEVCPRI